MTRLRFGVFFTKNGENRFTEMKNQMKVYTKRSIFKSVYIRRWVGGKIEKFGLIRIKKIQERNYYSYKKMCYYFFHILHRVHQGCIYHPV